MQDSRGTITVEEINALAKEFLKAETQVLVAIKPKAAPPEVPKVV